MVRDLFDTKDIAKVFSMLMLVVSVSPIIAPTLGGYITAALGWRFVFARHICIFLLILAGAYFFLPESKKADPTYSLKPAPILRNFYSVLRHPHFLTYALTGAISYAGLYVYVGGAPYIFIEIFKVSEAQFGWIFALIAVGLISASQVKNIALKYYSSEQVIKIASGCQSVIGIKLVCLTLLGSTNFCGCVICFSLPCLSGFYFLECHSTCISTVRTQCRQGLRFNRRHSNYRWCKCSSNYKFASKSYSIANGCCNDWLCNGSFFFGLGRKLLTAPVAQEEVNQADVEMRNAL
jgi:predicted MFS family arabinose efflux permease